MIDDDFRRTKNERFRPKTVQKTGLHRISSNKQQSQRRGQTAQQGRGGAWIPEENKETEDDDYQIVPMKTTGGGKTPEHGWYAHQGRKDMLSRMTKREIQSSLKVVGGHKARLYANTRMKTEEG